jgi:hypothetical protein
MKRNIEIKIETPINFKQRTFSEVECFYHPSLPDMPANFKCIYREKSLVLAKYLEKHISKAITTKFLYFNPFFLDFRAIYQFPVCSHRDLIFVLFLFYIYATYGAVSLTLVPSENNQIAHYTIQFFKLNRVKVNYTLYHLMTS